MRLRSILGEAFRNTATRTSKPLIAATLFLLVVGCLLYSDTSIISGILARQQDFIRSGATVMTLASPGGVNGAACDALGSAPNVQAAGAMGSAPDTVFSAFRSTPVPTRRATTGFIELLHPVQDSSRAGIYLSRDLADALFASVGDTVNTGAGDVYIQGIYDYPDDGRTPGLGYAAIIPDVPSGHDFDACWLDSAHPSDNSTGLLWTALTVSGAAKNPVLSQLNSSKGRSFDGQAEFASRLSALFPLVAFVAMILLSCAVKRARRLEFASALHSRVARSALVIQVVVEDLLWLTPAVSLLVAGALWLAMPVLQSDVSAVFGSAIRIIVLGVCGALLGGVLGVVLAREKHLFRYFKDR